MRICRLVDGLPLALELAAAWTRMQSNDAVAAAIEDDVARLIAPWQDVPPRHASLAAVFDHSWQLLSAAEQRTLARASIFAGPFDLDALTAVTLGRAEDLAGLEALGVKTDISLQNPRFGKEKGEIAAEKAAAEKLGITFVNLALPPNEAPPEKMLRAFFKAVTDPAAQPVYIHCKHGRDRTGTMVAAYRIQFDHLTGAKALAEMKTFGFKPEDYPYYAEFVKTFEPLKLSVR